jgi:hypothetical protein
MAQKRMIDKKISVSEKVADLSTDKARLLYTWMIPHADDLGLLPASPRTLKGLIVPMLDWNVADISTCMKEMLVLKLIQPMIYKEKKYIYITDFEKNQTFKKERNPQTILQIKLFEEARKSWELCEKTRKESLVEYTGFQMEPSGYPKFPEGSLAKGKITEDNIYNNDEVKNSDEFSELKESLGISDTPPKGISTEHQSEGLRIAQALGAPEKRYGAYIKVCKEESRALVLSAYGFAVDHPTSEARDKMFFWKLNDLKKGEHGNVKPSN